MPTKKGGERGWDMKFGVLEIIWKERGRMGGEGEGGCFTASMYEISKNKIHRKI